MILEHARAVLLAEAEAIHRQINHLNDDFIQAFELIKNNRGKLIVMGVGKSGHIGKKISATFASTGTPSFFVHPAEAGHGDLGMVEPSDVVLALSFSGESGEILNLLPALQQQKIPLIAVTGNPNSNLAKSASVALILDVEREACPLNLAPTSSVVASLALCDALAISIMQARGFNHQDFARSHPLGRLGRRLTLQVESLMRTDMPINLPTDTVEDALIQLTRKNLGATLIVENQALLGIFTDGDLRRTILKKIDFQSSLETVMTQNPYRVSAEQLASEALLFMEEKKITVLPVMNNEQKVVGIIQLHDLLQAGVL